MRSRIFGSSTTHERPSFRLVCDTCGSLKIKIENPGTASPATIVNCGRTAKRSQYCQINTNT